MTAGPLPAPELVGTPASRPDPLAADRANQQSDPVVVAAAALGRRLQALGGMAVTVESCTGGLIACAFTETAGSSAWFDRGFVTYTNDAKMELVGVSAAALEAHGAVSEPVAAEMARGGLARSGARLALSVTGIAGPGGGVPGKPVGTVCFGWALAAGGGDGTASAAGGGRACALVRTATLRFDGDRAQVRRQAALHALQQGLLLLAADPKD
ncbi:CinA family protein [Quisquiliibacterium transsilvanicum]|uniref:Nicotinamide-nucleotide amidase n=1 Tax=Quisquiliibacterium transsilvanicum TaxID=1549638 RepID=A0A7W8MA95_9BURK|nr:nicotinamide-nucleotide amidohydrolase family protein [Quisquiliibacterium transsilvanicum]MBB5273447.1 nicotinamide-nucleotide amidase [Quisquiliibacterium transsilvanicum]